jgi:3'-phosphoadenosine 5'-phosphosulfate sulfotransferase (PAPS reductase)/FAD synthetase
LYVAQPFRDQPLRERRVVEQPQCHRVVERAQLERRRPETLDRLEQVIDEIAASRLTERGATRADDKLSEAAMEDRKREGYF